MFFKQSMQPNTAQLSYFIGDEVTRCAVVVDPDHNIEPYMLLAHENNFQITKVILTHIPSEFIAGHQKLSEATGATIIMNAHATAEFEFAPALDKDGIEIGDVFISMRHTPGHTLDSMCIFIYDLKVSKEKPAMVLTGDTLFKGDCGYPDLLATEGHTAQHMAALLYDSIQMTLKHLPTSTSLFPGHAYGSVELDEPIVTTVEKELKSNFAFHAADREDFVEMMTAYRPTKEEPGPAYFVNRGGEPPASCLPLHLKKLSVHELVRLRNEGAVLVDFRPVQQFAAAHIHGSINIPNFANLSVFEDLSSKPAIIVCNPGDEQKSLAVLVEARFDSVLGYLRGGMSAKGLSPDLVAQRRRLMAAELLLKMESTSPPLLIDLRPESEWKHDGFVNSINIPFSKFSLQSNSLKEQDSIVLYCETEFHSGIAASILERKGFKNVTTVIGGTMGWRRQRSRLGVAATIATSHR